MSSANTHPPPPSTSSQSNENNNSSNAASAAYLCTHANPSIVTLATCNLNQWSLDFTGNVRRIHKSCTLARNAGATYRLGPELELCGYGCEDHFLESDTYLHCWESLAELFDLGSTDGLLCDFGMPVLHGGARYNCRVLCKDRRVLLVRPKTAMADDGNYRESRYFATYRPPPGSASGGGGGGVAGAAGSSYGGETDMVLLPPHLFSRFHNQRYAPFGTQYLHLGDGITLGCESCEELWTPRSAHIDMALRGVDIIGNASGSHHELRKLDARLELMVGATRKCGGVYLYSNQRGCDGGRLYYDGCAMIVCNGRVLAQAKQFDVRDVEVVTATVDLDDVRSYRASIPSFGIQAADAAVAVGASRRFVRCDDVTLGGGPGANVTADGRRLHPRPEGSDEGIRLHKPEEECCLGPACWLWDFLRRSGAAGFFLPLSGGADSSATATIVGAMCNMVTAAAQADPEGEVAKECRRVCRMDGDDAAAAPSSWVPSSPQDMASRVFHTAFMGTDNSSEATLSRAKRLGEAIGSYHLSIKIDLMVEAILKVFQLTTGKMPRFSSRGGTISEDLALQNIQARLRMVTAYLFAQLLPWVRGRSGFLLVLGSANVDEGLRGYMTKYDCSSADLNPIGAISKNDLKRMLLWAADEYDYDVLKDVASAPPTAELRPIEGDDADAEHTQTDEEDMGMTYEELGLYGRLRKISRCGPVSMYRKLCVTWSHLSPQEVAAKVKRFFYYYSINRHKMCTVTPAYHAEAYSPDDNRFDLRQFLYPTSWTRQFAVIDAMADAACVDNVDEAHKKLN
mmetsp:Transcript_7411/g.14774  ORF Transcript_7411/g.14774 Transcript_7411/m.14774 type:complete len:796 (-) Transcript_7411:317-2704(-)